MWSREHLRTYRDAPWTSSEELEAFVAGHVLPRAEIERLLAPLLDAKLVAEGARHRNRCSAFSVLAAQSPDPSLCSVYLDAIGPADPFLRRVLSALVPQVNDVEAHGKLVTMLGADDAEIRRIAAELLTAVGGPSALGHLAQAVAKKGYAGRMEAMEVMVPKARHRTVAMLGAIVAHGSPRERAIALRHLADPQVGGRVPADAALAMRPALRDPDRRVMAEACKAFSRLVPEEVFFTELGDRLDAEDADPTVIEAIAHYASPRAIDLLAAKLRSGAQATRLAAVDALRAIGADGVVKPLVEALHLEDALVRKKAMDALAELADRGAVDLARTVLWLLRSKNAEVRRIAAHLARAAAERAADLVPRLLTFLRDEDWWVRERVMDALVEMGTKDLTPHLLELMKDPEAVIRRFAIGGLLRLRDPGALGAILRAAIEDSDWWVREQAIDAAAELGDARAVPYLKALALDRPDLRIACLGGLEKLRATATAQAEAALVELSDLAADDNADVRLATLRALGRCAGASQAAFAVRACLGDDDPRVARAARELMTRWEMPIEAEAAAGALGLLDRLLVQAVRAGADDLLLAADRPPHIKRLGAVTPLTRGPIAEAELRTMLLPAMHAQTRTELEIGKDVDFSHEVKAFRYRFRVNVFRQATGIAAVFRVIKQDVPELASLGLPDVVRSFVDYPNGLVLVGGPTGSGKSTTLAALIDHVNRTAGYHVVTIEDPIEVVHPRLQCLINQREIGAHARTFARALRSTLRQDPDVILVGEMRDLETIEFAVNAAETGHLVLGTVHTPSAASTVDRMTHAFPPIQQNLVRAMLADSLRAVLCQQLLKRIDQPDRRAVACEVMINNDAVANLIRKNKAFQIQSTIATHAELGMRTMDGDLERLVKARQVDPEEALLKSVDKDAFAQMLVAAGYLADPGQPRVSIAPQAPSVPPPGRATSSVPPASMTSRPPARTSIAPTETLAARASKPPGADR